MHKYLMSQLEFERNTYAILILKFMTLILKYHKTCFKRIFLMQEGFCTKKYCLHLMKPINFIWLLC